MSWEIDAIERRLSQQDALHLREIWEPTVVAVQPSDARRALCVLPDGELRYYGWHGQQQTLEHKGACYIASRDGGLSWKMFDAPTGCMGSCVYIEKTRKFVTVVPCADGKDDGTWVKLSSIGPDDCRPECRKISQLVYCDGFQPKFVGKNRLAVTAHVEIDDDFHPVFAWSDDYGESWREAVLHSAPRSEITYPSICPRWENNGSEPVVTELPDHRLLLLARTSQDQFYAYYSSDGGDSWTDGEPSGFHGTLTTAFFLKMRDGRTLLFWNNTQPLPETNHAGEIPPHAPGFVFTGENVFTNRDANHCAVTRDGVRWKGFRELFLCEQRNRPDYRTLGDRSSLDRSVHQFQAIELPFGKVLVAFGQHNAFRRMVIFDPGWLEETSRREDFSHGLDGVSTHLFVKSYSGCFRERGHCQWNRVSGALLMPSPELDGREVLQIGRIADPRLVSEKQGVVWNFPLCAAGDVTLGIRIEGEGVRLSLCDRWFNPIDESAAELSPFSCAITPDFAGRGVWRSLTVQFDVSAGKAYVLLDGVRRFALRMKSKPDFGLSYLHLQTLAETMDPRGTLIRSMEMRGEAPRQEM